MRKTVYVLGNQYLETDNAAVKVAKILQKRLSQIDFVQIDPTEEFNPKDKNLIIIDTVKGINKVIKSNDLNHWTVSLRNTVHDYDLPVSLGILKKLGKIKKVTVIGVPEKGNLDKITHDAEKILKRVQDDNK